MRMVTGPHHRTLLPLSFLAGAVLLVGVVVLQHAAAPALASVLEHNGATGAADGLRRIAILQPGVITSLLGAPFFLYLLLRQSKEIR
jgi:ABC-type Fe3+-siderophore transport system permease subunit